MELASELITSSGGPSPARIQSQLCDSSPEHPKSSEEVEIETNTELEPETQNKGGTNRLGLPNDLLEKALEEGKVQSQGAEFVFESYFGDLLIDVSMVTAQALARRHALPKDDDALGKL